MRFTVSKSVETGDINTLEGADGTSANRLLDVFNHVVNGMARRLRGKIAVLNDDRGDLTVIWRVAPTDDEMLNFHDAWQEFSELRDHVSHRMLAASGMTYEIKPRTPGYPAG
jgi:hypothetical protein